MTSRQRYRQIFNTIICDIFCITGGWGPVGGDIQIHDMVTRSYGEIAYLSKLTGLCIFSATVDYYTFVLGIMLETEPFGMYIDQSSKMTTVVIETKNVNIDRKKEEKIHLNCM